MRVLGPRILGDDGPREGVVRVDAQGRVEAIEDAPEGALDVAGLVVPAPTNAHTHLADHRARGRAEGLSLEAAVAPPDGLKHRLLREASPEALVDSFADGLAEVDASGATRAIDFREQGPTGARIAREAESRSNVEVTVLGRPTRPEAWSDEADELLDLVDGIGISGLTDQPRAVSEDQAAWCREHGLLLALHLSEAEREDVEAALALDPDLIVHGTHMEPEDAETVASAEVPVVLCPRSNALFDNRPPVETLIEAGVELGLGTDNAMFHPADVWAEASHLVRTWPEIDPVRVLEATCRFSPPREPSPRVEEERRVVVLDDAEGLRAALTQRRVTVPWREPVARTRS